MSAVPALPAAVVDAVVERALREDIGPGDVTTEASVPADARARALITQKAPGVVFGLDCARTAFGKLDDGAIFESRCEEGRWSGGGEIAMVQGNARALLSAERTALNLLGHLSGVATLTARFVKAVEGTGTRILDTRKTMPGLRALEKAAVAAGGGVNHRFGLYDAFLLKENHIAMAGGIGPAVELAREAGSGLLIEVECRSLSEVIEAIEAGAPRILLDNMDPGQLVAAVGIAAGRSELEASGGVTLESIRSIAETGVDFVSVGALTHSAPTLDISLLLEPI